MKRIFIAFAFVSFAAIVKAQNVGIGTTTPSEKLTISSGNISLLSSSKGILLNGFDGPMINRGFDPFISGNYTGLGRWGLFMEPNNLTLGIPAIGLKAFAISSYNINSTINKQLFRVSLDAAATNALVEVNGEMKIEGLNTIEFGAGVAGKETNAGRIGYQTFTPGALDIVGAGTLVSNRKVNFFADGGTTFNGPIGINGDPGNNSFRVESGTKGSLFIENPIVTANATVRILRGVPESLGYSTTALWVEASGDYASKMKGFGGIYVISNSSARPAARFEANTTGYALETVGRISMTETGAAAGSVLTSDAFGAATWQSLAGSHNHFGEYWTGNSNFAGLAVKNTSPLTGKIGLFGISEGPQGFGVEGLSTDDFGVGVIGAVSHGEPSFPGVETNSGVAAKNTTGNGLYAISWTGYAIKAVKPNSAVPVTGPVALFVNAKTTNTSPILVLQNAATNPTALELNNGYIKVSGTNRMAFVHTTNAGNITNNISTLNYPNATATDMLFVTHNYSPVNTYFNYNYGVYWNGAAWNIYIEAFTTPMPVNINFNVMVIKQ